MTDFEKLRQVRLDINDPSGIIEFIQVDDYASLPVSPEPQTAYRLDDTGGYYESTDGTTYSRLELQISDSRILAYVSALGINIAPCRILQVIARQLGAKLGIVRNTNGADSTEFTSVLTMYQYYKAMADDCKAMNNSDNNNTTGRMGQMKQPEIGGGNL